MHKISRKTGSVGKTVITYLVVNTELKRKNMISLILLNFILFMPCRKIMACEENLPIVDLNTPEAAINLVDAFQNWGFSYVKGQCYRFEIFKI